MILARSMKPPSALCGFLAFDSGAARGAGAEPVAAPIAAAASSWAPPAAANRGVS
jgi:hypothetical protein